jgi:hypothetical protein
MADFLLTPPAFFYSLLLLYVPSDRSYGVHTQDTAVAGLLSSGVLRAYVQDRLAHIPLEALHALDSTYKQVGEACVEYKEKAGTFVLAANFVKHTPDEEDIDRSQAATVIDMYWHLCYRVQAGAERSLVWRMC